MRLEILIAIVAFIPTGCGKDETLSGTFGSDYTLVFDEVRAEAPYDQLIIRYLSYSGGLNEPARISVLTSSIARGTDISGPSVVHVEHYVSHRAADGSVIVQPPFPPVTRPTIFFDEVSTQIGRAVKGHFSFFFADGSLLSGAFDTWLSAPP
jgi:hypothetical protein